MKKQASKGLLLVGKHGDLYVRAARVHGDKLRLLELSRDRWSAARYNPELADKVGALISADLHTRCTFVPVRDYVRRDH